MQSTSTVELAPARCLAADCAPLRTRSVWQASRLPFAARLSVALHSTGMSPEPLREEAHAPCSESRSLVTSAKSDSSFCINDSRALCTMLRRLISSRSCSGQNKCTQVES